MNKIFCIAFVILITSCDPAPKIDYRQKIDTTSVLDNTAKDTTKILVSELPMKFDSVDILIFPVGLVDLLERGGYSKGSSDSYGSSDDYSYGSFGNWINLVFQDNEGNRKKLTDKKILIRNLNFMREIFRRTKTGYILYFVSDRDSNGDSKLDYIDLEAMYVSKVDGTEFKKLTKELHQFYDYKIIEGKNRIYYRTLEDKDKDGVLNNKDKFHYYYIEFSSAGYVVTEYNPLEIFE